MTQKNKSYIKAVTCFIIFLVMQLVGGALALLLANFQPITSGKSVSGESLAANPQWIGIGLLVADLITVILLWATMLIRRRPLPCKRPAMPYHWAIPLGAFLLMSLGLNLVLIPMHLDDGGVTDIFEGMRDSVLCMLTLAVIGPIIEELIFREGIQRHLKNAGLSSAWAIGISATLFGVAHANVAQAVAAIMLGIVLGLLYERTGDIRLSAPAHILNNTIGVIMFYFPEVEEEAENIQTVPLVCSGILLVLTAFWILGKWWAASLKKTPSVPCE